MSRDGATQWCWGLGSAMVMSVAVLAVMASGVDAVECQVGSYDDGSGCQACPVGTTTLASNSTQQSDCVCMAGSYEMSTYHQATTTNTWQGDYDYAVANGGRLLTVDEAKAHCLAVSYDVKEWIPVTRDDGSSDYVGCKDWQVTASRGKSHCDWHGTCASWTSSQTSQYSFILYIKTGCASCPAVTTTLAAGGTSIADCACQVGHYGVPKVPVAHFPLDGNILDSMGVATLGEIGGNSPTFDPPSGSPQALDTTSNGHYIDSTTLTNIFKEESFSISMWIMKTSDETSQWKVLLTQYDSGVYGFTILYQDCEAGDGADTCSFYAGRMRTNAGSWAEKYANQNPRPKLENNVWHNLIFVFTATELEIYLDGTSILLLEAPGSDTFDIDDAQTIRKPHLGLGIYCQDSGTDGACSSGLKQFGYRSDIRFYRGVLTADERAQIFSSRFSNLCTTCPNGATTLAANSTSSSACVCQVGGYGPYGSVFEITTPIAQYNPTASEESQFDGTYDGTSIGTDVQWNTNTNGGFTVIVAFELNDVSGENYHGMRIMHVQENTNAVSYDIWLGFFAYDSTYDNANVYFDFGIYPSSGNCRWDDRSDQTNFKLGKDTPHKLIWTYIQNSATKEMRATLNGVTKTYTCSSTFSKADMNANDIVVGWTGNGYQYSTSSDYFTGKIFGLYVFDSPLPTAEAQAYLDSIVVGGQDNTASACLACPPSTTTFFANSTSSSACVCEAGSYSQKYQHYKISNKEATTFRIIIDEILLYEDSDCTQQISTSDVSFSDSGDIAWASVGPPANGIFECAIDGILTGQDSATGCNSDQAGVTSGCHCSWNAHCTTCVVGETWVQMTFAAPRQVGCIQSLGTYGWEGSSSTDASKGGIRVQGSHDGSSWTTLHETTDKNTAAWSVCPTCPAGQPYTDPEQPAEADGDCSAITENCDVLDVQTSPAASSSGNVTSGMVKYMAFDLGLGYEYRLQIRHLTSTTPWGFTAWHTWATQTDCEYDTGAYAPCYIPTYAEVHAILSTNPQGSWEMEASPDGSFTLPTGSDEWSFMAWERTEGTLEAAKFVKMQVGISNPTDAYGVNLWEYADWPNWWPPWLLENTDSWAENNYGSLGVHMRWAPFKVDPLNSYTITFPTSPTTTVDVLVISHLFYRYITNLEVSGLYTITVASAAGEESGFVGANSPGVTSGGGTSYTASGFENAITGTMTTYTTAQVIVKYHAIACADEQGGGGVTCPVGSYADGASACQPCPTGKTTLTVGGTSIADCVCISGSYDDGAGGCAACPVGTTTLAAGATSEDACVCQAGGYQNSLTETKTLQLGDTTCNAQHTEALEGYFIAAGTPCHYEHTLNPAYSMVEVTFGQTCEPSNNCGPVYLQTDDGSGTFYDIAQTSSGRITELVTHEISYGPGSKIRIEERSSIIHPTVELRYFGCTACPPSTTTLAAGGTSIDACVCQTGSFQTPWMYPHTTAAEEDFDGDSSMQDVTLTPSLSLSDANNGFSIILKVEDTNGNNWNSVFELPDPSGSEGSDGNMYLTIPSSNRLRIVIRNPGASATCQVDSSSIFTTNSFHDVVVRYKTSENKLFLKVNSNEQSATCTGIVSFNARTYTTLHVGKTVQSGWSSSWIGNIAGLYFFDEYLDDTATTNVLNSIIVGGEDATVCVACAAGTTTLAAGGASIDSCVCQTGSFDGVSEPFRSGLQAHYFATADVTSDSFGQNPLTVSSGNQNYAWNAPERFLDVSGASKLTAPTTLYVDGQTDITLSVWLSEVPHSQNRHILRAHSNKILFRLNSNGNLFYWFNTNSCERNVNVGDFRGTDFQLLTLVKSGTNIKVYVDKVLQDDNTDGDCGALQTPTGITILSNADNRDFIGNIRNFRIYNRALTATEVAALYDGDLEHKSNGFCASCPSGTTLGAGKTSQDDCVCQKQSYGDLGALKSFNPSPTIESSFDGTNSATDKDLGPISLSMTNGFTIVTKFKLIISGSRVYDQILTLDDSTSQSKIIYLRRYYDQNELEFRICETGGCGASDDRCTLQSSALTKYDGTAFTSGDDLHVVARSDGSSMELKINGVTSNGKSCDGSPTLPFPSRSLSNTFVGKSSFTGHFDGHSGRGLDGNMYGLYIFDRYLDDTEAQSVLDSIVAGGADSTEELDLVCQACPVGTTTFSANSTSEDACVCESGSFKSAFKAESLTAWYKLETDALDYGPNGLHLLPRRSATPTFHADGYMSVNDDISFSIPNPQMIIPTGTKELTVSFWVRDWTNGYLLRIRESNLYFWEDPGYNFYFAMAGTEDSSYAFGPTSGDWHLVVAVFDQTDAKLYIDRISEFTVTTLKIPAGGFPDVSSDPAGLFCNPSSDSADHNFIGDVKDIRFYTTAFTAAEVMDLYLGETGCAACPAGQPYTDPEQPATAEAQCSATPQNCQVLNVQSSPAASSSGDVTSGMVRFVVFNDSSAEYTLTFPASPTTTADVLVLSGSEYRYVTNLNVSGAYTITVASAAGDESKFIGANSPGVSSGGGTSYTASGFENAITGTLATYTTAQVVVKYHAIVCGDEQGGGGDEQGGGGGTPAPSPSPTPPPFENTHNVTFLLAKGNVSYHTITPTLQTNIQTAIGGNLTGGDTTRVHIVEVKDSPRRPGQEANMVILVEADDSATSDASDKHAFIAGKADWVAAQVRDVLDTAGMNVCGCNAASLVDSEIQTSINC